MGTLYITIILLVRIVQNYSSKNASILLPKTLPGNVKYYIFMEGCAAVLALCLVITSGGFANMNAKTAIISAASGISLTAASIFGLEAMKKGTVALSSMFGTAGIFVPCIAGIFLFHESMSLLQCAGIGVFIIAAFLLVSSSNAIYHGFSLKTFLILMGTLLFNGLTMLFQKMFAFYVPDGAVSVFSFFTFVIPSVAMLFYLCVYSVSKKEKTEQLPPKLILFGALGGLSVFLINQLATLASYTVSSAVLFTFINGGNMIIAALMGAVFFKEKLSVKSIIGMILGILALVTMKAF